MRESLEPIPVNGDALPNRRAASSYFARRIAFTVPVVLTVAALTSLMVRRAGYEVRVLPEEGGSCEENPPTLLDFIRHDLRWCQGNMQYWRLLAMPGLKPVSRSPLLLAILMFAGSPFWILFMTLGILRVGLADDPAQTFDPELGLVLLVAILFST